MPTPRRISLATSSHPADIRLDLWSLIEDGWVPDGFGRLPLEDRQVRAQQLLDSIAGVTSPTTPEDQSRDARISYQIEVLREIIVQGALFFTARILVSPPLILTPPSLDDARGAWVGFCILATDAVLRSGHDHVPADVVARVGTELPDQVIRRLAHELPDRDFVEAHLSGMLARLRTTFADDLVAYASLPYTRSSGRSSTRLFADSVCQRLAASSGAPEALVERSLRGLGDEFLDGIDVPGAWKRLELYFD